MAWSHESRKRKRQREAIGRLPISSRLDLLRTGKLSARETADFAADAGNENYVEAEAEVNQLLDHTDAIVRYNAMATVAYEWGRSPRVDRIIEILSTDEDEDCRRQAAGALGSLHNGRRDRRVLDVLVRAITNVQEVPDVRSFAYTAALDVIGVPRHMRPNALHLEIGRDELLALNEYLKALQ